MKYKQPLADRVFDFVATFTFIAAIFVIGHSIFAFAISGEPFFSPIRIILVKE